jgi:acyl dehydratase
VANLGFDEVRLPAPVFVGDTLYAESEITDTRPSKSRPYAGIVSVSTRGYKQDGTTVITYKRSAMIYTREGSPRFK